MIGERLHLAHGGLRPLCDGNRQARCASQCQRRSLAQPFARFDSLDLLLFELSTLTLDL